MVADDSRIRYDPEYFEKLFEVEDSHFWFRARNEVITTFVRKLAEDLDPPYRVLEIGCGTGNVLRCLEGACDGATVVGMDAFKEGLRWAQRRSRCALVQANAQQHPFAVPFDLLGLFDVLEHIPDDSRLLRDILKILRPGGHLLLTVPANSSLWSYFDEASGHCRRYGSADLGEKLASTGYEIEFLTPLMSTLYPLMWCGRRLAGLGQRLRPRCSNKALANEELQILPLINEVLAFSLAQEARWLAQGRKLMFGTSLLALARRPA